MSLEKNTLEEYQQILNNLLSPLVRGLVLSIRKLKSPSPNNALYKFSVNWPVVLDKKSKVKRWTDNRLKGIRNAHLSFKLR